MEQHGQTTLIGTGHYLPPQSIPSEELMDEIQSEKRFGIPKRFLASCVGVKERRHVSPDTPPSALAIKASLAAIANAKIDARDIDYVLYCGIERDWQEPATAHRVQEIIGASNSVCFDISNACHGFMNGLAVADALIGVGSAQTVLVCTGEVGSTVSKQATQQLLEKGCDRNKFKSLLGALTLGDAGGAMLVRRADDDSGFKRFRFTSAGEHAALCYYKKQTNAGIEGMMDMEAICQAAYREHRKLIEDTYEQLEWQPSQVAKLIVHQAGARPNKEFARIANIDYDRTSFTIGSLGNIASATIPVNLALNPAKKGDKVLLMSTGSGLSVGQTGMVC